MSEVKNVPELRFSAFFEPWKTKRIGDICKVSSGGTPNRGSKEYWEGNIPWITTSQIDFGVISSANEYITEDGLTNSSAKLFPKGTVLMAMYGQGKTRGQVAKLGLAATTNQACAAFLTDKETVSNDYLFQSLVGKYQQLRNLSNQGGQDNLSAGLIKSLKLNLPKLEEQQKIADFLSSVDKKIEQLTEKHRLLTEYKKGVMQKIFTQQIRFKDNQGNDYPEWEEKYIGQVLSIGSGKDYKHLSNGDIPVFGTGGYMLNVNGYLYDGESVCIGRKGTIDKPMFLSGKFWTVDTLFFTHSFKKAVPRFIFAIFQQINWQKYNEASGVPSLSKSTIDKIKIEVPCVEEQQKTANFLTEIDQKIDQAWSTLQQTKAFKKGLLQKMFV